MWAISQLVTKLTAVQNAVFRLLLNILIISFIDILSLHKLIEKFASNTRVRLGVN